MSWLQHKSYADFVDFVNEKMMKRTKEPTKKLVVYKLLDSMNINARLHEFCEFVRPWTFFLLRIFWLYENEWFFFRIYFPEKKNFN